MAAAKVMTPSPEQDGSDTRRRVRILKIYKELRSHITSTSPTLTDKPSLELDQECESAFTELKPKLTTAPVLAFPRFNIPFILDVDASGEGFDALLTQISGEEEHPFELTIVACSGFATSERWLERLAEFDFDVQHWPGKKHSQADSLSRKNCEQCKLGITQTGTRVVQAVHTRIPNDREVSAPRQWPELRCGELNLAQEADEKIQIVTHWLRRKTWPTHPPKGQNKDLTANVATRTNG
ncbi:hypothetical protein T07_6293 [Trichinella nelsoni]|uniref:Reverse transcriptase/retrotransposon-derived protein RNase H-like domain-containing protein n=1 Tax=Trichinella nelsoni TaxID=6336 RepID=A0A0V0SGZ3_9BILA|nr:hypothetical protein T07_6293 [Trichinella nelsoni]